MTNLLFSLRSQGFTLSYRDGGNTIKYSLMKGHWEEGDFHRLFKLPWHKVSRMLVHQCGSTTVEGFLSHLLYIGEVSQPHEGMYLNDEGTSQFM